MLRKTTIAVISVTMEIIHFSCVLHSRLSQWRKDLVQPLSSRYVQIACHITISVEIVLVVGLAKTVEPVIILYFIAKVLQLAELRMQTSSKLLLLPRMLTSLLLVTTPTCNASHSEAKIILGICEVSVASSGRLQKARALLDSGSHMSFMLPD